MAQDTPSDSGINSFDIIALQYAFTFALQKVGLDKLGKQIESLEKAFPRSPDQDRLLAKLQEERERLAPILRFRGGPGESDIPRIESQEEAKRASELANSVLDSRFANGRPRVFRTLPEDFFPDTDVRALIENPGIPNSVVMSIYQRFIDDLVKAAIEEAGKLHNDQLEEMRNERPGDLKPLEFDPGPVPLEPLPIDPKLKKEDEGSTRPERSTDGMGELAAGLEGMGEAGAGLEATFEKVDRSMEKVFDNMVLNGVNAGDELRRVFASLDSDILGSLGGLGSIISQIFGGGPLKFLGSLFGLAGGGTAQPGLPILVGERGPEIFLPGGPGQVLNAHNTARAMGVGAAAQRQLVVHQTNTFSTDVKNTVRAEVMNALPLATNLAARQVMDALRGIRY